MARMDPNASMAQLLGTLGTQSGFATRFRVKHDPQLHVDGVGSIALPMDVQTAHRLCAIAQPASHGYKDETRLDKQVRDTWEIAAHRLRFDAPTWPSVLERALKKIAGNLGLPRCATLRAELHNLLVYAPGQFFIDHQDSEKTDGMIGTLVVNLPSHFEGGEFVIEHLGKRLRCNGAADQLEMVAFYADCHHEVRPVKQGYRVVLTYNLISEHAVQATAIAPETLNALAQELHDFWNTPTPSLWTPNKLDNPPDRLVYLLDHEYTRSGLSWTQLKGADVVRVAALRQVAERLDAEIFLALADVHETWAAEEIYRRRRSRRRDDDTDDTEGLELGELINDEIELDHWIALDGSTASSYNRIVQTKELCLTRENADCKPFDVKYTGYMGNYGNTLDRWYHRAAVILWPRERTFAVHARQSPTSGLAQIAERVQAQDIAQALAWTKALLPHWSRGATDLPETLITALTVADAIHDPETAAALLDPFMLCQFHTDTAAHLVSLLEKYGLDWCRACLKAWATGYQAPELQLDWMATTLPAWAQAFDAAAHVDGRALIDVILRERWQWLQQYVVQVRQHHAVSKLLRALERTTAAHLGLLRASVGMADVQQQMLASLLHADMPLQLPLNVLRHAHVSPMPIRALGLAPVHAHCVQVLHMRLAQPQRDEDDWSITPPATICKYEPGKTLAQFLRAPNQRVLQWRAVQDVRQTVERIIAQYELPVQHETLRTSRPYILRLEKMPSLFTREAAERRQWASDLDWLQQTADAFNAT